MAPSPPPSSSPHIPLPPLNFIDQYEQHARTNLPTMVYDYYSSGAMDEITLRDNVRIYERLRILPKFLRDVSKIDTTVRLSRLGIETRSPIWIAPTAMQRMAHKDGEEATARAANKLNTLMTLSTYSTTSLEDAAKAYPTGPRWLQLYVYNDRWMSESIIKRAEKCGYKAIVLTVDTPFLGRRLKDLENKFRLPEPYRLANFDEFLLKNDEKESGNEITNLESRVGKKLTFTELLGTTSDLTLNWEKDIAWLKSLTNLPIIVKGILTAHDTRLALDYGVDGIVCSNHGGRQLDTVPPTLLALPEIIATVRDVSRSTGKPPVPVFLDGGIRRGTDVFKALALGAEAIFVGRPILYGLSYDGQNGVEQVLNILNDEFRLTMALAGTRDLKEINRDTVRWDWEFTKL